MRYEHIRVALVGGGECPLVAGLADVVEFVLHPLAHLGEQ